MYFGCDAPVVVSAVRTAIGKFGGSLSGFSMLSLAEIAGKHAIERAGIEPDRIDEVILSCARQAGTGPNPGRALVPLLGIPEHVPGWTVNMACGSGLKAIETACQSIATKASDVVLVVGAESMSQVPYLLTGARWGYKLGSDTLHDALHKDGFMCAITKQHMGLTAENVAKRYAITRKASDAYAVLSQQRVQEAISDGRLSDEIIPVAVPTRKGAPLVFSQDEHPRADTTPEALSRLRPVFSEDGIVTAASASGIADGAAAVLIMSSRAAKQMNVIPRVALVSIASVGCDPNYMGLGPVPSTQKALQEASLDMGDIDLIEINEAFSPQVLACEMELGYDRERANVNGGAIALGHPIGMTGVRLLVALTHSMPRHNARFGLATACINGGMGMSVITESIA